MRISDWSSDVCSSDLRHGGRTVAEGIYVSAALAEMLRQYLDDEGAAAPGLRARLTSLADTQRMPMEIWWALLQEVADVHPRVATGIEIGKHARPHHVGVLGYLALSCDPPGPIGQASGRERRGDDG